MQIIALRRFAQTFEAGGLLIRDGERLEEAFALRPNYMRDVEPRDDEFNFADHGIARIERVMSDNGACYRSSAHAAACSELGLRHLFTQPYRPRTNGKAERFIQTLTNRWAYGAIYGSSAERTAALPGWLTHYNFKRRHGSLGHKAPATRLAELNNVMGNYT